MFDILKERIHQGHRTLDYPRVQPTLSDRYMGLPKISQDKCPEGCTACLDACPTKAIALNQGASPILDMGYCLFCGACSRVCPSKRIQFTSDFHLATRTRQALCVSADSTFDQGGKGVSDVRNLHMFDRSLKLRQVSAGGCNACEVDANVLTTLTYDLGHFGIDFVASPRHADALLITGPVTQNMYAALMDAYVAMPEPRIVIALGVCAISGGLFRGSDECRNGVPAELPIDVYIPGCPPSPWTILDGLLLPRNS